MSLLHLVTAIGMLASATGCDVLAKYQEKIAERKAAKAFDEARRAETKKRASVEAKGKTFRTGGPGFSIPVPAGYSAVTPPHVVEVIGDDAVVLSALSRAEPGWFLPSIVFIPTAQSGPTDANACAFIAQAKAREGWRVEHSGMVEVGGEQRCRIDAPQTAEEHHGSMLTEMATTNTIWAVTCNYDPRDEAAKQACTSTLEGWRLVPDGRS